MISVGIILFSLTVGWILYRVYSAERPFPFPAVGTAGAAVLLGAEMLLFAKVEFVTIYFTPIAWTAYIAWTDSAVFSLKGKSLWQTARAEFLCLALCSIPLWLIFEAYNLRLANWVYVGLPENRLARGIGYAWSFATIWPAILETATLVRALGFRKQHRMKTDAAAEREERSVAPAARPRNPRPLPSGVAPLIVLVGAILLTVPLLAPPRIGSYLFGAVWLGFIFLLEPINLHSGDPMGSESLWRDIRSGDLSRLASLLGAGWVCGILWEFWNYWAEARWVYTFPVWQEWKLFAMPLPGYLGFPPFAVECFVLFSFLAPLLSALAGKPGRKGDARWKVLQL